jgi:hypothetical protein
MADYYVTPKRMRPYDLKSAKALTEQPVWVKEGYKYSYYPFDTTKKRSDFSKEAGTLIGRVEHEAAGDGNAEARRPAPLRDRKRRGAPLRQGRGGMRACESAAYEAMTFLARTAAW